MREREVFVVVRRGDEFLVLRRVPRCGGYWHCVAGGVEEGESSAEAAAREVAEETGLRVAPTSLDRQFSYSLEEWEPRYSPDAPPVTVDCFVADAPAGWEPTLNDEHDEYRWCWAEEAERLLFWPEPRELVRDLAG